MATERKKRRKVDPNERQKENRGYRRAGRWLNGIGMVLLLLVIVVCIPLTVPRIFGYQVYNVISGSMAPAIPTGSLVYVKSEPAGEIETDDVIAFYSAADTGAIITHRVLENHTVSGEFITKGDANEQKDPLPVEYEYLLGKVVLSVPVLGEILAMAASAQGKIAVACMIGASILFFLLGSRFSDV